MLSGDVILYLIAQFGLSSLGTSADGEVEYHFDKPFGLVLTEVDRHRIALFAPLDLPGDIPRDRLLRRLLEAGLQGVETGQGSMCLNDRDRIGYRDVIDLADMSLEQVQLRFVDFSLYFDFWRSAGVALLRQDLGRDDLPGDGLIRI